VQRRIWIPALLGVLSLCLLGYGLMHPTVTIRLSRDEVQRRIDERLPLEGSRFGVAYSVGRAAVDLRKDGRIGVDADVSANALNRRADLLLAGNGELAYRDGAFYIVGFKVTGAAPRAVDEPLADEDPAPKGRLSALVDGLGLRDRGAKALEASGIKDGAAFLVARKDAVVATVRERGAAMLAEAVESRPVYRLKDTDVRQSLARLALRDVRVEDGALAIDLNVMHAALRVLLYAAALLLGLGAAAGALVALGRGGPGLGAMASLLD
jgi:hypothetical protein